MAHASILPELIHQHENSILEDWLVEQARSAKNADTVQAPEHRRSCTQFLNAFEGALRHFLRDRGGAARP